MSVSPRTADTIRKLTAYTIAGVGTWLLLRVLFRLANAEGSLADPELWIVLVLAALMTAWVRAAKPVRKPASNPTPSAEKDGSPPESPAS